MNSRQLSRAILLSTLVITLFGVKVGSPGETVHINGTNTGVGVDTTEIPEAFFEVRTDEGGILIPRLTILQRDAILAPANGLMIYNTDCLLFNYFNGIAWIPFPASEELVIGSIAGSETVCEGAIGEAYSISPVTGATSYIWSLPSGATVTSGDGTESIEVDFGSEGDDICVTVTTMCGSSTECLSVTVSESPVGGVVTGGGTISLGESTGLLTLSGHTGDVDRWQKRFAAGSWTDIATTATVYSETPISAGIWDYRAVISAAGCSDAFSDYTTVTVEVPEADSIIFSYTGSVQTWTVPTGVTSIEIECWGGEGGDGYFSSCPGGLGGYATGSLAVTPGATLYVYVGGAGGSNTGSCTGLPGGWNGGGNGGSSTMDCPGQYAGAGGAGASDVRSGGTGLTNRVIVAAGGAGGGGGTGEQSMYGGDGGGLTGLDGVNYWGADGGGDGGTQTSGGAGGFYSGHTSGGVGTLGTGGNGGTDDYGGGGGGGGGYYGGGGGSGFFEGGGGGGSSYIGGVTSASTSSGVRTGNGRVMIAW